MTYARLDDVFPEHQKVEALSDRAFRLHVTALCYCSRNLTDGVLTERAVRAMCAAIKATIRRHVGELIAAGLWGKASEGWVVHHFREWNPSAEEVKERRAAAKTRMADARALKRAQAQTGERSQNVPEWRGLKKEKRVAALRFLRQAEAVWFGAEPGQQELETRVYLAGFTDDEDVIAAHIEALGAA